MVQGFLERGVITKTKSIIITIKFLGSYADQMPELYKLDDYDKCLSRTQSGYCMVYAEIVPDNSSKLWNFIDVYSKDYRHHFRHDHLLFGICVDRCKILLETLSLSEQSELYDERVESNEITDYYAKVHREETAQHSGYQQLLGKCLNYDFRAKFGLQLKTFIEYCEYPDKTLKINGWALAAYGVFAIFVVVNILSSCYDYYLLRQQTEDSENIDFYKRDLKTSAHKLSTSFSIYRNYYRLMRPLPQEYEQLKFLNGYRFICVFMTIAAHTIVYLTLAPIQNIIEIEEMKKSSVASILQGGPVIIQTFFLITAFMLKLKFNDLHLVTPQTKMSKCCKVFAKVLTLRYLRIVPSLIMFNLFEAFLLQNIGDGPLWKHVVQPESVLCREYWWKNVFMLNNILIHYSCSHHTWYLATDMQLTVFFLIIAIVLARFPNWKKCIYAAVTLASIIITSAVTYILKLQATTYFALDFYRHLFVKDYPTFYHGYVPFYMNLGAYLGGFILADIYSNYIRCDDKVKKRFAGDLKYKCGYWLIYLAGFLLICSSSYFINYESESSPFLVAAYAGLFRNVWAFVNVLAFLGNFFKLGSNVYRVFSAPVLSIFHKISYQLYLWHIPVLRTFVGIYRQPFHLNLIYTVIVIFISFLISSIVAFIMTLTIEYPLAILINYCFKRGNEQPLHGNVYIYFFLNVVCVCCLFRKRKIRLKCH
uniref:Acyltransferase 3 domain-containing protein n=1 Tax=Glossina pallidipes TaxID=7398 RepID=A0A1A9ZC94_GLOPL